MTSAESLKGEVKLRLPIVHKIEDGWLWYLSGAKPQWKRGYYMYGSEVGSILNQGFGENGASFYKDLGMSGHNGLDWWAPDGATLFAVQDGTIGWVNDPRFVDYNDGYGGFVELFFTVAGNHYRYVYGHLQSVTVSPGQRVFAGQVIGTADNTGKYTTGSHLHTGFNILDGQLNRLYQDNGYLGYVDDSMLYISELKSRSLEPIEKLYWHERITGKGYYGLFGSWNWAKARQELDIPSTVTRSNYYDYSNSHKYEPS